MTDPIPSVARSSESAAASDACERLDRHDHDQALGCSRIAHARLGWCAGLCSDHTDAQEAAGWRLLALAGARDHRVGRVPGRTGHCAYENHEGCDGSLRMETGWRWFCACPCHPEPSVAPEHARALDRWRKDRAALVKAGEQRG